VDEGSAVIAGKALIDSAAVEEVTVGHVYPEGPEITTS
jgi:hypothetical protein